MPDLPPIHGLPSLSYHDANGKLWQNSFARFTLHNPHQVTGARFNVYKILSKTMAEQVGRTHTYYGIFEAVHIEQIHYLQVTQAMAYMDADMSLISWRDMYRRMLHIAPADDPLLDLIIMQCQNPHTIEKRKAAATAPATVAL